MSLSNLTQVLTDSLPTYTEVAKFGSEVQIGLLDSPKAQIISEAVIILGIGIGSYVCAKKGYNRDWSITKVALYTVSGYLLVSSTFLLCITTMGLQEKGLLLSNLNAVGLTPEECLARCHMFGQKTSLIPCPKVCVPLFKEFSWMLNPFAEMV